MNALIDGAIDKARMVLVILVFALVAGTATYIGLPKEAEPEIDVPIFITTVPLEGISPEDSERLIVRPAETELQTIEGIKQMDGIASEGVGQVVLEFNISFNPEKAESDIRKKVDLAKREFPDEAKEPVITEINTSLFPILVVNLYGDVPERGLYRIARDLQDNLEALPGVLEARVQGEREEVLEIVVDPNKLETYNLSYQEILNTVSANNQLVPAGQIDTGSGRFPVKVPGLIKSAEDAFDLPVRQSGNAVIKLSDVADIRRTFKDREVFARFNGKPAVSVQIIKRSGANILSTVDSVNEVIADAQSTWPDALRSEITSDQSGYIRAQITQLQASIMTAVLLVMIIVVAALGLRSAALVGVAIPASFVMAFLLLGAYGLTLNTMVMFGMLIAVGILVDGAIVVVEYADRKMAEGLERKDAYAAAAKRMFWPIVASNATTLAAFVPFLFWNSLVGRFMSYLPLTLIFVLTSSLIMALVFLPVLGSLVGGRASGEGTDDNLAALSGADGDPARTQGWLGGYARLTQMLISRPASVSIGAVAVVFAVFLWFGSTTHRAELFLDIEPEEVFVFVSAQGSLSADEELEIVERVERAVLGTKGVQSVSTTSGSASGGNEFFDGESPNDAIGRLLVTLQTKDRGYDGRLAENNLRERIAAVPGARVEIARREQGPPAGKDIQVSLTSNNQQSLDEAARQVRGYLDAQDNLMEIDDSRPLPGIEWQLDVDREHAGRFGVDVSEIGAAVQLVTNGALVGLYRPDDALDEVDIRVRLPEGSRSLDALDDLRIATPQGQVPVSLFVDRVPAQKVSSIERRDGIRVYTLRANATVQGEGPMRVADMKEWIAGADLPRDVDISFQGADEDAIEANAFFQNAALAALFLMAVILLWEFNNFYHVLLTLSAVVLSTTGVLIGIQIFLPYISILMLGTGVVALAGIVVNNNIVLIDTFQRLRADGRSAEQAAIAASAQRIRPILLTTFTTICGLLPMMFQMNVNFREGLITFGGGTSEWWVQLSTAVVFGLGFSTIMTLIVTPVWLALPEKLGRFRDELLDRDRDETVPYIEFPEPAKDDIRPAAE
ncbi:MAG: efflux RND transporter permease subunit [Pseudomonadota bacterium]